MNIPSPPDPLSERQYTVVVLRLVVDRRRRLLQGAVVDVNGQVQNRFIGWRGLTHALRDWLARQPPIL